MIDETRELRELKNEPHELRLDMIKTETRLLFSIYGIAAFVMIVVSFTVCHGVH
jgi:hypothetical protein